jgi:hypothetical protein
MCALPCGTSRALHPRPQSQAASVRRIYNPCRCLTEFRPQRALVDYHNPTPFLLPRRVPCRQAAPRSRLQCTCRARSGSRSASRAFALPMTPSSPSDPARPVRYPANGSRRRGACPPSYRRLARRRRCPHGIAGQRGGERQEGALAVRSGGNPSWCFGACILPHTRTPGRAAMAGGAATPPIPACEQASNKIKAASISLQVNELSKAHPGILPTPESTGTQSPSG